MKAFTYLAVVFSLVTPSCAVQVEGGTPVGSPRQRDVRQPAPQVQPVTVVVSAAGDSASRTRVDEFCGYLATYGVQGIADTSNSAVPAGVVHVTLTFGQLSENYRSGSVSYRNDDGSVSREKGSTYQVPISVRASAPGLFWGTTEVAKGSTGSTTVEVNGVGSARRPSGNSTEVAVSNVLRSLAKETAQHVKGYTPPAGNPSVTSNGEMFPITSPQEVSRPIRPVIVTFKGGGYSCNAPAGTYTQGQSVALYTDSGQYRFNRTVRWDGKTWRFDREEDLCIGDTVR